ncbi:redoxin domain-containing protein [Salinibaculum rarum]|uniref:redoxin domain-containing protein n=1 Tax=Salinibaculum rarum TaxID=3058903 RepID=UPI002660587D|nr:redoxin domain-containing protein [Salinibaculum sp. KK48]
MIAEGDVAPEFSLPAVVDGDLEEISLADYVGDDIVILAFYPADFNPACGTEETDLDELDLFTMQKDVTILGISADSVYSHRAFADEYDLHIPLLADVHGEVAAEYGVTVDDPHAGYLTNRAVVVIDPDGEVQYAWQTEELRRLPPVDEVREAVDDIGGDGTAEARYRVGHAHYVEGRRAFTSGMQGFSEREWMMAQNDFTRARTEFEEAEDQFDTAVRFSEDETAQTYFERAEQKAQALWQAAEWLADSASAYASGEGAKGKQMRTDAETPLETARDIPEPPDPDDFPPEEDPADSERDDETLIPTDDRPTPTLGTDIDGTAETPEAKEVADEMAGDAANTTASEETDTEPADAGEDTTDEAEDDDSDEIDDEELEEIAAELEEQTKQAKAKRRREARQADNESDEFDGDDRDEREGEASPTDADSAEQPDAEDVEGELDEDDIELDLADPTDGTATEADDPTEDEDDEDDENDENGDGKNGNGSGLDSGSHGVPDSL